MNFQDMMTDFMKAKGVKYLDQTKSFELDFAVSTANFKGAPETKYFYLELKEKGQNYNISNWPTKIPNQHLFICDDLTLRKLLLHSPDSALVIRDNTTEKLHLLFIIDLFYISKIRVNRIIKKDVDALKGKCLLDLRNSLMCRDTEDIFIQIGSYLRNQPYIFSQTECYGYYGEHIGIGGLSRDTRYWKEDLEKYAQIIIGD